MHTTNPIQDSHLDYPPMHFFTPHWCSMPWSAQYIPTDLCKIPGGLLGNTAVKMKLGIFCDIIWDVSLKEVIRQFLIYDVLRHCPGGFILQQTKQWESSKYEVSFQLHYQICGGGEHCITAFCRKDGSCMDFCWIRKSIQILEVVALVNGCHGLAHFRQGLGLKKLSRYPPDITIWHQFLSVHPIIHIKQWGPKQDSKLNTHLINLRIWTPHSMADHMIKYRTYTIKINSQIVLFWMSP